MKIKRILVFVLVTAFVMNMFIAFAVSEATASLTIDIDNGTAVQPGEEFSVSVNLGNLSEEVYMFQFAVTYDSSKLILQSTSAGNFFATAGSPTINSSEAGIVYINWDSINKAISENCTLMLLTFSTVGDEPYETTIGFSESEEVVFANWDNAIDVSLIPLTVKIGVDAIPTFETHSLVLSGQIGVNFFMDLPAIDGVDYAESYMTFEISGKGTVPSEPVPYDSTHTNAKSTYYGFSCYVNSIQMADTITATFHYGDGLTVSEEYSIKQYISSFDTYIAEHPGVYDDKTIALVHALADYGHHVQPFLSATRGWTIGDGTNQYAEMDLSYAESYDITAIKAAVADHAIDRALYGDIEKVTYSLLMDSDTAIYLYFKPVADYDGSFTVTIDGETATATKKDNRYLVIIPNIGAHKLGDPYTVVATTANGESTVTVSALSYVYGILNSDAYADNQTAQYAAASIYHYYAAATEYKRIHP